MLENLKNLRKESNVSQKALADAIGVSQQSVNKYENHNIEPDINTLILMADYFDTSVDFLIGRTTVREQFSAEHPLCLSDAERTLVTKYRRLNDPQRKSIDLIMENYTQK
jgi:transcriptional regulator with XRE-family HTH domain